MKNVVVLGAGMVGRAIAADLSKNYAVTSADINAENLSQFSKLPQFSTPIKTVHADLSDAKNIEEIITGSDLVIGAVPGFMGFNTIKSVINAGKNMVDISFFPEDAFLLDDLAQQKNVTAIVDCGVAPGISNILLGYHYKRMQIESFDCLVGGLPVKRTLPFQYKAPFSPIDVIEEYIRPARYIKDSKILVKPALSEPELVEFEKIGTLEAFNTDGLRTLIKTMNIPNMRERTLRYPGHSELMRNLRDAGFFDETPLEADGITIRPIDVTRSLLFPQWKLEEGEDEFTVMRIAIEGTQEGIPLKYLYNLHDKYHKETNTSSMARTTGYTCTAVANLMLEGRYTRHGISPPEYIGENGENINYLFKYLRARGVNYTFNQIVSLK